MRYPPLLKYLHEKPLPRYPLWNPGDPRHRIFLPLYWLRIVKPLKSMPKDFVKFECHWQMTSSDVRQYLEKLYDVSVFDVRIEVEKGEQMKNPRGRNQLVPPLDDRKFAYVQLKDTQFEFPNVLGDVDVKGENKKQVEALASMKNKEKNKHLQRFGLGGWFF